MANSPEGVLAAASSAGGRRGTYRRLLGVASRYWPFAILAVLGMLFDAGAAGAFTYLIKPMLDELFVARDKLPDDLEDDEFYQADLVGLDVRDGEGTSWGRVAAVHDFGGGTVIELKGRKGAMIPFTHAAVPQVDIAGGSIIVDPVAAGLIDLPDEDESEAP